VDQARRECGLSLSFFEATTLAAFVIFKQQQCDVWVLEVLKQNQLDFVDVLHSDIQGYEFEMLQGAHQSLHQDRIGYLFISTHSNDLHDQCINKINEYNYEVLCQANLNQSYSWDGLIVAKSKIYKGLNVINISHYEKDTTNPRNTAKKLQD